VSTTTDAVGTRGSGGIQQQAAWSLVRLHLIDLRDAAPKSPTLLNRGIGFWCCGHSVRQNALGFRERKFRGSRTENRLLAQCSDDIVQDLAIQSSCGDTGIVNPNTGQRQLATVLLAQIKLLVLNHWRAGSLSYLSIISVFFLGERHISSTAGQI